jgi:hypothetical protein
MVLSIIPYVGVFCCGPITALLLGTGAGYLGVRWGEPKARIGQGVLSGALTGLGALIGSVVFFILALIFISTLPQFNEIIRQALEQQNADTQLTVEDFQSIMNVAMPFVGGCVGLIGLLFALGGGALGGWLRLRQNSQETPPLAPMPPTTPDLVA